MKKLLALISALALVLFLLTGCGGGDAKQAGLTPDQAAETLNALLTKVGVSTIPPRLDISGTELTDAADELPDITNYPLSVLGSGSIDVEIVASTEKAGSGMDGWLNQVAENFNKSNFTLNGKTVSVSIRPIPPAWPRNTF
jgi:Ca-activated chloride channel family protein